MITRPFAVAAGLVLAATAAVVALPGVAHATNSTTCTGQGNFLAFKDWNSKLTCYANAGTMEPTLLTDISRVCSGNNAVQIWYYDASDSNEGAPGAVQHTLGLGKGGCYSFLDQGDKKLAYINKFTID